MTEPLDSAKVMAAHQSRGVQTGWPLTPCLRCGAVWPCLPYRLAADLAEANRKLAAVEAVHIDELIEYEKQRFREGLTDDEDAVGALMQVRDHLRAALGGAA